MNSVDIHNRLWFGAKVSMPNWTDCSKQDPQARYWWTLRKIKLQSLPNIYRLSNVDLTHEVFRLFRNIAVLDCQTYLTKMNLRILSWNEVLERYILMKSRVKRHTLTC